MIPEYKISAGVRAVILAGGAGTRLLPYTTVLPKPLMPVGDRPILERVLVRLREAGVRRVTISIGHLAELIRAFFGDGEKWGIEIDYAIEDEPLGTMGPLKLIGGLGENFFVLNGDVLTDLDITAVYQRHLETGAALTIATYRREVKIDFGVLHCGGEDGRVTAFEEKPTLPYNVSMGVYVLSRRCLDFIPSTTYFGFDHLVLKLLEAGENVQTQRHEGQWLDIGRPEDYDRANREMAGTPHD